MPHENDERLSAYLDGMLGAGEMREVMQTLDHQPATRKKVEDMGRLIDILRALPDPEAPPNFWPTAMERAYEYVRARLARPTLYQRLTGWSRHYKHILEQQLYAFQELLSRYERRFYAVAYRLTGTHNDAQDLLQEALCEAFANFHRFQPGTSFDRWVFRILKNKRIDQVRRDSHVDVVSIDQPPRNGASGPAGWDLPDPDSDPADILVDAVLDERIQTALNGLAEEYRQAVVLVDMQGLSYEEAAGIMGCRLGTVRSRLHRGRTLLREALVAFAPPKDGAA